MQNLHLNPRRLFNKVVNLVKYEQGQFNNKIREYFYFIDHQGMVFLDDTRIKNFTSSFKDAQFLTFLIRNLKRNETANYQDSFPYISLCGVERNYVRCDDLPIVFTHIFKKEDTDYLAWGYYTGERLAMKFEPEKLYMHTNGRIYYPTNNPKIKVGLVRSQIAIELSSKFVFSQDIPIGIIWNGQHIALENSHVPNLLKLHYSNNNKIN